jgi:hypothetical protein
MGLPKLFSTVIPVLPLLPYFVTGFTDAEGCFTCTVTRSTSTKSGWHVQTHFVIGLNEKDH